MKNHEILDTYEALISLRERSETRLPASTVYAIIRNMRILQPIAEDITIARMDVLKEYGDPVPEQPGFFSPKIGKEDEMNKALEDLASIENDVDFIKIPISSLDGLKLSMADMDALYFMVDG